MGVGRRGPARLLALALAVAAVPTGCGPDDGRGGAPGASEVVDSASIRVTTVRVAPADAPVWAVSDSAPFLRLGALDGPEPLTFGSVSGVLPLPDGGVAVADGQAREIRLFDGDGAYRGTLGGAGGGPGEFGDTPRLLELRGDTLLAWDARGRRVTRFDLGSDRPAGTFALGEGWLETVAPAPGGGVVVQVRERPPSGGPQARVVRDSASLVRLPPGGGAADTLLVLPAAEAIRAVASRAGTAGGTVTSVESAPRPFGRDLLWTVGERGLWGGPNDRFELRRWDANGRLTAVIRWPAAERPPDPEVLLRGTGADIRARSYVERMLESFPPPDLQPAFGALMIDDGGRLWVAPWGPPTTPGATTAVGDGPWWVFAGDTGELLGSIVLPPGLRVDAVRGDAVYGVVTDSLGVSYVEAYRVRAAPR